MKYSVGQTGGKFIKLKKVMNPAKKKKKKEKSGIREAKNLLTDADNRTDTILKRLHDLFHREGSHRKKYVD